MTKVQEIIKSLIPDGSKIISRYGDQTIHVWDMSTGLEVLPVLSVQTTDEVSISLLDWQIVSLHQEWFINSITGQ